MARFYILILIILSASCKKETSLLIEDNTVANPYTVSTIKVRNYVNKLFIDLLGRTPTDIEKDRETALLQEASTSMESRRTLIRKLQSDTVYIQGDSSYKIAYYNRIYNLCKARLIEGASDGEFLQRIDILNFAVTVARLEGDSVRVFRSLYEIEKNKAVLDSRIALRNGDITINQMYAQMLNNSIYDVINMNSFNFINASFDDLFDRFPTQEEFNNAYPIIENNVGNIFWGVYIDNKFDYCSLLTSGTAFNEGLIQWTYINLLGRACSSLELFNRLQEFNSHQNYQLIQEKILQSNEYAQF